MEGERAREWCVCMCVCVCASPSAGRAGRSCTLLVGQSCGVWLRARYRLGSQRRAAGFRRGACRESRLAGWLAENTVLLLLLLLVPDVQCCTGECSTGGRQRQRSRERARVCAPLSACGASCLPRLARLKRSEAPPLLRWGEKGADARTSDRKARAAGTQTQGAHTLSLLSLETTDCSAAARGDGLSPGETPDTASESGRKGSEEAKHELGG